MNLSSFCQNEKERVKSGKSDEEKRGEEKRGGGGKEGEGRAY